MIGRAGVGWVGTLVSPIEGLKHVFSQVCRQMDMVGTLVSPIEGLKHLGSATFLLFSSIVGTLVSPIEGLKRYRCYRT